MTLPLTPDMLHGAYEYLRTTPPFKGWRLPDADEVEFNITTSKDTMGSHQTYTADNSHIVSVSGTLVGHSLTLLVTVAHEMVHMRQWRLRKRCDHGPEFVRLAARVCKYHGFDPRGF